MPQSTADALLSRRKSWDGVVIQGFNAPPDHPIYGHYGRVKNSWRNPDTGEWRIDSDLIGPARPEGEPIYTFDGTTWDMPAQPMTVFPYFTTGLCATGAVLCWPVGHALFGNYESSFLFFIVFVIQPLWTWFSRVEPTRATKVHATYIAANAAQDTYRNHRTERADETNQSVRNTAQSLWPKPADPTERIRSYGAIDPLVPGWEKPPPPDAHIVPWGRS